jgi:hypothetical protein
MNLGCLLGHDYRHVDGLLTKDGMNGHVVLQVEVCARCSKRRAIGEDFYTKSNYYPELMERIMADLRTEKKRDGVE